MEKYVDKSLGGLRYTMAIIGGNNRQVTQVVEHIGNNEVPVEGDFVLTIGRSAVILT